MLHKALIAVDGSRNSLRAVEYAGRVFAPNAEARLVLFHVLQAISRMTLNKEEIKAIDARKAERADLANLYWQLYSPWIIVTIWPIGISVSPNFTANW